VFIVHRSSFSIAVLGALAVQSLVEDAHHSSRIDKRPVVAANDDGTLFEFPIGTARHGDRRAGDRRN